MMTMRNLVEEALFLSVDEGQNTKAMTWVAYRRRSCSGSWRVGKPALRWLLACRGINSTRQLIAFTRGLSPALSSRFKGRHNMNL